MTDNPEIRIVTECQRCGTENLREISHPPLIQEWCYDCEANHPANRWVRITIRK